MVQLVANLLLVRVLVDMSYYSKAIGTFFFLVRLQLIIAFPHLPLRPDFIHVPMHTRAAIHILSTFSTGVMNSMALGRQ